MPIWKLFDITVPSTGLTIDEFSPIAFNIGTAVVIRDVRRFDKTLNMRHLLENFVTQAGDPVLQGSVLGHTLLDDPDAVLDRGVRSVAEVLAYVG